MRDSTEKWIKKALGDYAAMNTLAKAEDERYYDNICFHAQQCIEKFLKALLIENDLEVPHIHDLQKLLNLVVEGYPVLEQFRVRFTRLTRLSVEVRYPYESAGKNEAEFAVQTCREGKNVLVKIVEIGSD